MTKCNEGSCCIHLHPAAACGMVGLQKPFVSLYLDDSGWLEHVETLFVQSIIYQLNWQVSLFGLTSLQMIADDCLVLMQQICINLQVSFFFIKQSFFFLFFQFRLWTQDSKTW